MILKVPSSAPGSVCGYQTPPLRSQAGPGVPGPASVLPVFPGCIVWEPGLNNLSVLILATFKEKH